MGIEHAARPKLTKHLRVGGPFNIGSVTLHGVSHGRLAVGVATVNRHRCLVRHAGTRVRTLLSPVRSRKANRSRLRPSSARRKANRPRRRQLPPRRPPTCTRRKANH